MIAAILLLLASPQAVAVAAPIERSDADLDARMVKARTIVERTMPAEQREQLFRQMLDGMMANMVSGMMQGDPKLAKILESNANAAKILAEFLERQKTLSLNDLRETGPAMIEAIASAYAKRFTLAELAEVEAFVVTPTGARFLQTGMQIFNDPAIAEWQRQLFARTQARNGHEMRRLMEELTPILEKQDAQPSHS